MRLTNPAVLAAFDKEHPGQSADAAAGGLGEKVLREPGRGRAAGLIVLASFVAVVMGIGAVFGAMNTMYAIVPPRTREIGTLRALGFSALSILLSFVMESVLLAIVGGLLGCLVALPMNGYTAATGTNSFSELAFAFKVTPGLLLIGLAFAVLMGFVGGLLPAFRAARMPITQGVAGGVERQWLVVLEHKRTWKVRSSPILARLLEATGLSCLPSRTLV